MALERVPLIIAMAIAGVAPLGAQEVPPDTVTTVFVSDTIADYGAEGGVAVDGLGFVYVADFRNAVWRLSPDGDVTKHADGLYGASGNAIGPRGDLYSPASMATTCRASPEPGGWRCTWTRA